VTEGETRVLLCTNDDGIHAPGLSFLADAASVHGEVHIVAPDREQSASSHALTLHRPLRLTPAGDRRHTVDGTPTDCVLIAVKDLLEPPPALVLSGVNHGPNMAEDVLYSGTVAAAMEATILGVPAVAISYAGRRVEHLSTYGSLVSQLIGGILAREEFPPETVLNINLPDRPADETLGVRVTALGRRVYHDSVTHRIDPRGNDYIWIGGGRSDWSGREDSDFRAVAAGYVSITPLHLDLTSFASIEDVRAWGFR